MWDSQSFPNLLLLTSGASSSLWGWVCPWAGQGCCVSVLGYLLCLTGGCPAQQQLEVLPPLLQLGALTLCSVWDATPGMCKTPITCF